MLTSEQFKALVELLDPDRVFNIEFDRTARGDKLIIHYFTLYAKKTDDVTYYWSPGKKAWVTELRGKK